MVWTETMRGTFIARVAAAGDCELAVIGMGDLWCWRISRGESDLAEGMEGTLAAAKAAAEVAVSRIGEGRRD